MGLLRCRGGGFLRVWVGSLRGGDGRCLEVSGRGMGPRSVGFVRGRVGISGLLGRGLRVGVLWPWSRGLGGRFFKATIDITRGIDRNELMACVCG